MRGLVDFRDVIVYILVAFSGGFLMAVILIATGALPHPSFR